MEVLWSVDNEWKQDGLEEGPQPVLILSGDHDFVQLQRYSHVQQYSPIHKKWVKADKPIEHILREHILRGDDGDGIPNFLSDDDTFVVEKKRQKSLFEKDMVNWITLPIDQWEGTPHWKNIQRNDMLVNLLRVPEALKTTIINTYLEDRAKRDRSQLFNFFMQNKMNIMMQHAGEF